MANSAADTKLFFKKGKGTLSAMMGKMGFKNERESSGNSLKAASKKGDNFVITTFIPGSPNLIKNGIGNSKEEFLGSLAGVGCEDIQREDSSFIIKNMVWLKGGINGGITSPYLVGNGTSSKKMEDSLISIGTGMAL